MSNKQDDMNDHAKQAQQQTPAENAAEQKAAENTASQPLKTESAAGATAGTNPENASETPVDTAAESSAATAEAAEQPAGADKLSELQASLDALNDRYLRLMAEFDNYRKRTIREKADLLQSASGEVLKDLLPVIDDYERGLKAMESTEDVSALREGMSLVYSKMRDFLQRSGVQEMEVAGQPFDTDRHEALTKIPAPDAQLKGCVVDVVTKGYMLHDKVLRFAKVVVGE